MIYPGKLTKADCFRLGNIGRLFPTDIEQVPAATATITAHAHTRALREALSTHTPFHTTPLAPPAPPPSCAGSTTF